jgi:acyl transferase domain-containing protein/SAM-dependent methyltransferase
VSSLPSPDPCGIALVGMAGRFPGAPDLGRFWRNLCDGVESISRFTPEELREAGVDPGLAADPSFVPAGAALDGVELFDAGLFRFTPREAELLDPQHRLLLEHAWEALENAGHAPGGRVGVFAGASFGRYLHRNLRHLQEEDEGLQAVIGNDKDFLSTRLSYKLDLRGPSLDVQTACSTSLVAVWMACQSLLSYQCDLALAGAVSVALPQRAGYRFQEGGILSRDGRCRPFDADAGGTVRGSGVGMVVLRRLEDALADGDTIRAVVRGVAVNNDGALKAGYSAPSADGQAEVVEMALALAGVRPGDVTFVEGHGTATPVGDPIEVRALERAFQGGGGSCVLGSVKGNIGHLDVAAGIAGLIKTVLALEHRQIPPTAGFTRPNPLLGLESGPFRSPFRSPFRVNDRLIPWDTDRLPRRAGVSSFGIGGTNAHAVLEEAPEVPVPEAAPGPRLLVLSARTPTALDAMTANLVRHLRERPELRLADVARTLQGGRKALPWRRAAVVRNLEEAEDRLAVPAMEAPASSRSLAFLFPGQGRLDLRAAAELYEREPVFREALDECRDLLAPHLGLDVGEVIFGQEAPVDTLLAQPALFAFEHSLARLWMAWGVQPRALLGHSLGELVAACLAGVFSLPRALALVALRGRLAQSLPPGGMLAVSLSEEDLAARLVPETELAAVNAPRQCVASGPPEALAELEARLDAEGIEHRRLPAGRAFHSRAVEPVLAAWEEELRREPLGEPAIPFLSNVTGTWIEPARAASPAYWAEHLRRTVRFADGLRELDGWALLEVGPGRTLTGLAKRQETSPPGPLSHLPPDPRRERGDVTGTELPGTQEEASTAFPLSRGRVEGRWERGPGGEVLAVASLPGNEPAQESMLEALGQLWMSGVPVEWQALGGRRVPLPTYPFERRRYWIEPVGRRDRLAAAEAELAAGPLGSSPPAELDGLCALLAARILRESGVDTSPGRVWELAEMRRRIGLPPRHERLLRFLLRMLAEDGFAALEGDAVRFLAEAGAPEPLRRRLDEEAPVFRGLYDLLDHCAGSYPRVLRGEAGGLEVLYPGGSSELLRQASRANQEDNQGGGGRYEVAARLLRETAAELAAARGGRLRVLEVGAGEGILTSRLAPALADGGTQYMVTDLGRSFVLAAEERAASAGWTHMEFGVLDISRDPAAQGFAPGSFDLVTGANVVHATPRIDETLGHLKTLLAPGGVLALLESVRQQRWSDLIWGLTDGWWGFEDAPLRTSSPLLSAETWQAAFGRAGLSEAAAWPRSQALREASEVALLIGRRPAEDTVAAAAPVDARIAACMETPRHHERPALRNPYAAPRDEMEEAVANIWGRALGIAGVGVHDNFFELGGDSLTALQVARAVERRFGLPGGRFLVFENPSVAAAARFLAGRPEESVEARSDRGSRRRARRASR